MAYYKTCKELKIIDNYYDLELELASIADKIGITRNDLIKNIDQYPEFFEKVSNIVEKQSMLLNITTKR
jgi:predicted DNA-binding protein YlxM (UPF0122 family)